MAKPKAQTVVVWILAILLGALFLMGAVPKLQGGEAMKARFADWGYSSGFLLLIGILEGLGGLLLIFPRTSTWGAAILVAVMAGAAYTHLASGIGSPWTAIVFGLVAAVVGWLRRRRALFLGSVFA